MLKRLLLLAGLLSLASPAFAAGTIAFSLSQQFDSLGKPLANCFFYTLKAGETSTPQSAFQDSALTLALPNPMRCDASGRLPQFFLADGLIKVRITDKNGVSQAYPNGASGIDNIQVIGPSGGGGGGGTVDPTTILATGDFKLVYNTGVVTGFVRCNGRTIGSATSGATERANADTSSLFAFLWGADANLAVSGGRGASAAADYAANKTLTLPDCRNRVLAGLGDMGNVDAFRLTPTYFGGGGTTLGAVGGSESKTLLTANLPPYTPSGSVGSVSVLSTIQYTFFVGTANVQAGGNPIPIPNSGNSTVVSTGSGAFTGAAQGGTSTPFAVVQPTILVTTYIKL
jgi:hypothetical protein